MPFGPSSANKSPLEVTFKKGSGLALFMLKLFYNRDDNDNI